MATRNFYCWVIAYLTLYTVKELLDKKLITFPTVSVVCKIHFIIVSRFCNVKEEQRLEQTDTCDKFFVLAIDGYVVDKEKSGFTGLTSAQITKLMTPEKTCTFYK